MAKFFGRNDKEHEVFVDNFTPFVNEKYTGIRIEWSGTIGWGQYDLIFDKDSVEGYSECMDSNEDKGFLKALFEDFITKVNIKE
jgi:hypothetical protein